MYPGNSNNPRCLYGREYSDCLNSDMNIERLLYYRSPLALKKLGPKKFVARGRVCCLKSISSVLRVLPAVFFFCVCVAAAAEQSFLLPGVCFSSASSSRAHKRVSLSSVS